MQKIFITQPLLPDFEALSVSLREIYASKWLTNMGAKHNELERALEKELDVPNIRLFNNGTIALLVALKALDLPRGSEVITTPFTFAATAHCISWNGLKPVFADIEPHTMTLDADKIEPLITPNTSAILPVHVYGFPCDVEKLAKIAAKHGLKLIYDGAHAFSTRINGESIANFGDITMFSFHATKLFNTIEGGALAFKDANLARKIENLRNFGIENEEFVSEVGINGKMNEVQAAWGLLNLKSYKFEQNKRAKVKAFYDENLSGVKGLKVPQMPENTTNSYQYYPLVIEDSYPLSRDEIYTKFRQDNIMTRKYFHPVCTDFECYESFANLNLKVANDIKGRVLCLPYYGDLPQEILVLICDRLRKCFI